MIHQQQGKVKYGTATIPYYIIKTRRIKTSELIVDANMITVRAPLDKNKSEIQRLVLDKASWILKKQRECKDTIPQIIKPTFKKDTTLPYLGSNYPLTINRNQPRNSIEIIDGKFSVQVKSAKLSNNILKELYDIWLAEKAQRIFEDKVRKYSKRLGVRVERIVIRI